MAGGVEEPVMLKTRILLHYFPPLLEVAIRHISPQPVLVHHRRLHRRRWFEKAALR